MDKNRIIELLARKMASEATPEELDELDELISGSPDAVYYEEVLKELWLNSLENNAGQPDAEQLYLFHQLKFHQDFAAAPEESKTGSYDPFGNLMAIAIVIMVILLISFACWTIMGS
jgi:transmembrane sensor